MKKIVGLVIVGSLLMFALSTVVVTASSIETRAIALDNMSSPFSMFYDNLVYLGGPEYLPKPIETRTYISDNVSNSFPMFSNAEYVNFTIDDNTINLTLDVNASFDGVCNLANLTGTNISASGSFAVLEYSTAYQTDEYGPEWDQKWNSAPYFNDTENRLYLLDGSGWILALNLELNENATNESIPKVVGFGDLTGKYSIETVAHSKNSTYNYLALKTHNIMKGLGYTDLYVQYAPDTSYEDTPFIPTFSHCPLVQAHIDSTICGLESTVGYATDILGVVKGADPISGVSHDWNLSLELDAQYFPTTYRNDSCDQTWDFSPHFDDTENRLYLLSGTGILTKLDIELKETATDEIIPKVVGIGDFVGCFFGETVAQGENSTYNHLSSNMRGVGYADPYVQYAPDTTYENVTFIPTFSQCERLQLSANIFGSSIKYVVDVLGYANGVEYLEFNDVPLDSVAINETFNLTYHSVNISGAVFNETWSVKPEQYKDTLVILRGTGNITGLDFTFDDRNATHPEIRSYGYLRGDCNVTENILPHYMRVFAIGTNVSAMDESGQGGFGITFT